MSAQRESEPGAGTRRAVAEVNLGAIERNCARLRSQLRGGAMLCAVVKADGYGHGALRAAQAALSGGARWLAVASAEEAIELRSAGVGAAPILVMGALTDDELRSALAADADVVAWHEQTIESVAAAGGGRVHVKLDTGMGRLGTRDPTQAMRVVRAADEAADVRLAGIMTHFATADEHEDDGFFLAQLEAFERFVAELRGSHPEAIVHAANSAATLREPRAHFDMVRCGIAVYGMDPFGADALARDLTPALELRSYVADVKRCRAGESVGYGRRFVAGRDTWVGVLPLGYGDGFRRGLSNNCEVLIAGTRVPVVGTVSMDNVTVDLGPDPGRESLVGADATVIGVQGQERISAEELARRLATINYEITCGISARVPRTYVRGRQTPPPAGGQLAAAGERTERA
jgi:alanine racemase